MITRSHLYLAAQDNNLSNNTETVEEQSTPRYLPYRVSPYTLFLDESPGSYCSMETAASGYFVFEDKAGCEISTGS